MTLALSLPAAIRTTMIGSDDLAAFLSGYKGEPAVFTKRPAPTDAQYPLALIASQNAAASDQDMLVSRVSVLQRDISVYGRATDQVREVDQAAELIYLMFHRQKWSLSIEGFHVIDIVARRPSEAPSDDNKLIGRLVPLTIRLQDLSG